MFVVSTEAGKEIMPLTEVPRQQHCSPAQEQKDAGLPPLNRFLDV